MKSSRASGALDMHDSYAQFLITVGDVCTAAELARLHVEVLIVDGSRVCGVPASLGPADQGERVNETGYPRTFRIDDALVNLDDIVECALRAPAR
jgi:hypothetical protein